MLRPAFWVGRSRFPAAEEHETILRNVTLGRPAQPEGSPRRFSFCGVRQVDFISFTPDTNGVWRIVGMRYPNAL